MEELATYTSHLPAQQINPISTKQADIGRLLRKIKIKLTDGQFRALHTIITFWLHKSEAKGDLYQQAYYLAVYKLFTAKVQNAPFNVFKAKIKLSLDLIQADTLITALQDYQFDNSTYEMNVILYIIQEIDKQTV